MALTKTPQEVYRGDPVDANYQPVPADAQLLAEEMIKGKFDSLSDLTANISSEGAGTIYTTRKEGFSYVEVASGGQYSYNGVELDLAKNEPDHFYETDDTSNALTHWQGPAPYTFSKIDRIQPEWGGAVGDGNAANSAANLAALVACANYCAAESKIMVLPRGSDYAITSQVDWTGADGLVIEGRGAQISFNGTETGNGAMLLTGDITADEMAIHLAAGQSLRRFLSLRGKTRIGDLIATSVDQINNRTNTRDAAIVADYRASDILIGNLVSENFDNALSLQGYNSETSTRDIKAVIQNCLLKSFVRGMHFDECLSVTVTGGRGIGDSPNAAVDPGHNFVLSEGTKFLTLEGMVGEDCGEHTYRVGTSGNSLVCQQVNWSNLYSARSGGSGGKINDNATVETVKVSNFSAVDCGPDGGDLANSMGLFVEKAQRALIDGLHVSSEANTYAAYRGLSMNGVRSKTVTGFSINKTEDCGVFDKSTDGVMDDTMIDGGLIWETETDGIRLEFGASAARNYHIGAGVAISHYDTLNSGTYYGIDWNTSVNAAEHCSVSARIEDRGVNAAGTHSLAGNGTGKVNDFVQVMS